MKGIQTQGQLIRAHLESGKCITQIEALNFYQCLRLASRICDLRREGLPVQERRKKLKNGKQVSQYYLLNQTLKTKHHASTEQ